MSFFLFFSFLNLFKPTYEFVYIKSLYLYLFCSQLKWMEENCDDEQTSKNLRRAATQTLDRFSIEGSPFYSDERILYVSMIIVCFLNFI